MFCCDACASVCDSAQTLFALRDSLVPMVDCGENIRVGVADAKMFPDFACGAGVKKIRTSTGVAVSLYAEKYTTPSLCVRVDDSVCYAGLAVGAGGLSVSFGGSTYVAQDLPLCFTLKSSDGATLVRSSVNSVLWHSVLGNKSVAGVSHCADFGGAVGTGRDVLSVASDVAENKHCWCRMSVPLLSRWVYSMEFASDLNCNKYCSAKCAEIFAEDASWRASMWENLSELTE